MNIKRFFFAFAAAAAAIFASSCEQNLTPGGDGKISVAQTELSFEIDGLKVDNLLLILKTQFQLDFLL